MGSDGDLLRAARERMRLTQAELASKVGVSRATVGSWESGTPPRSSLGLIREVLGLDEHLRPTGSGESANFSAMSNGELVARFNTLVAQLNAVSVEVAKRLLDADFDTVDPTVSRKAGYSEQLIDGRYVANVEDIELDPPAEAAETSENAPKTNDGY
jgi:transcriptional regulator with XRE-family HTH domain